MVSSGMLIDDLDLELSLAQPNAHIRAPPTLVFPNSSYHHGSTSHFSEAVPSRAMLWGGMIGTRLTPAEHWHIAHRPDKVAVEESHALTMHHAASTTNLGLRLLARTRECAALTDEVASLKAQVTELQRRLDFTNQHIETLQQRNVDREELLQVLQAIADASGGVDHFSMFGFAVTWPTLFLLLL